MGVCAIPRGKALWPYSVRRSPRAKRVTLKLSTATGLEVVVPLGFDESRIPQIIESKADWISKHMQKTHTVKKLQRPESIKLRSIQECWSIEYQATSDGGLTLHEGSGCTLVVEGAVDDPHQIVEALNEWLKKKAGKVLIPWLHELSRDLSTPFTRVTIRRQKTRWGSCSKQRSISLNRNLLFFPAHLVRYVLVHELCHTKQLDHSKKFWDLVERYEPDARKRRQDIGSAESNIPPWARLH
jgi:predicted metal-dependent hydrolase